MKKALYHLKWGAILTVILLIAGCTVTKLVETPPGSGQYKKVAETDPRLTNTLNGITAGNESTSIFNPYSGLITLGVGFVAAIAEWNRRRKQAQLDAIVAGVESANNTDVKKAIQSTALARGVEGDLNKTVQRVTGG